jgi:hypothetical protein
MKTQDPKEIVAEASSPTIQDEVLLEAGRKLLLTSVDDSRNYCQQMIGVAAGAVPIYLAILKLWLPDGKAVSVEISILFALPALLFLLAAASFSTGYLPQQYEINVGNVKSIEYVRSRLMSYRAKWGLVGFSLLCLGILTGMVSVLLAPALLA